MWFDCRLLPFTPTILVRGKSMTEPAQATKACPMCGESILAVAIKCKHCGSVLNQPQPMAPVPAPALPAKKPSGIVKWGGGFIAAVVALGMCGKLMGDKKPEQPQQQAAAAAAAIQVTNDTLWREYDANEVAADNKYKGKVLAVSGTVASIDKDFMDNIVVHLLSPNEFMNTSATMQKSEAGQAAALSKGQHVKVVCEGNGRVVGSPVLKDCVLQ
jgi:putative nucleic acid binding protein